MDLTLSNDTILRVAGNDARNGWGVEGSNGGDCEFLASNQILTGGIIVDSISKLEMTLSEGTVLTGTVNGDGEGGPVSVILDGSSQWVLTGDSYITAFSGSRIMWKPMATLCT